MTRDRKDARVRVPTASHASRAELDRPFCLHFFLALLQLPW